MYRCLSLLVCFSVIFSYEKVVYTVSSTESLNTYNLKPVYCRVPFIELHCHRLHDFGRFEGHTHHCEPFKFQDCQDM